MKKIINLVLINTVFFLLFSCVNNGGQHSGNKEDNKTCYENKEEEKVEEIEDHFSYQLLGDYDCYNKSSIFNGLGVEVTDYVFERGYYLNGLIICLDNNIPVYFDDEEDEYNNYIYEWTLALKIATEFVSWNKKSSYYSDEEVAKYYQRVLPSGDTIDISKQNIFIKNKSNNKIDTVYTITKTFDVYGQQIEEQAFDRNGNLLKKGDTIPMYDYELDLDVFQYYLNNCVYCLPSCIDGIVSGKVKEVFKKTYYDLKEAHIYQPDKGYGYRKYPIDEGKYGYDYVELFRIDGEKYENVPNGALGIRFKNASIW